jgi:hypothetical protein
LESFSYVLQFDMHFICTPMWTKFYSCKKWVLHSSLEDSRVLMIFEEKTTSLIYCQWTHIPEWSYASQHG